jgi:hypothetical protein
MWIRTTLATLTLLGGATAARADFSLICDEKAQVEDILRTDSEKGFDVAKDKFRAYIALRNERNEPTCEMSEPLQPTAVGAVVSHFESIEFLPAQLHDVVIVEIRVGERSVNGTINRFVAPKAAEVGL